MSELAGFVMTSVDVSMVPRQLSTSMFAGIAGLPEMSRKGLRRLALICRQLYASRLTALLYLFHLDACWLSFPVPTWARAVYLYKRCTKLRCSEPQGVVTVCVGGRTKRTPAILTSLKTSRALCAQIWRCLGAQTCCMSYTHSRGALPRACYLFATPSLASWINVRVRATVLMLPGFMV